MIIQLTQLLTKQHRPDGMEIQTLALLLNVDKVVGFEPYEYQRLHADDRSTLTGSTIIFDDSANQAGAVHVVESVQQIAKMTI